MIYFGFDLGDGESCITWSRDLSAHMPSPIAVNGDLSFPSAVGYRNGEVVVGQFAVGSPNVEDLRVCFKRHFLENKPEVDETIKRFVQGVMAVLRMDPEVGHLVDDPEEACFIVGCPAGWKPEDRERYRQLLTDAGMKNVRIASESRAAFESALRCNPDNVDAALIEDSVLVIDIGSSTLDLAYVCDGQEHAVEVMGDTKLGGGLMDEMILQYALSQASAGDAAVLRAFFRNNPGHYSNAMYKARALKEQYFTNESYYFETNETITAKVSVFANGKAYRLFMPLSPEIVENYIIAEPHPLLDHQSFESKLANTIKSVHHSVREREPKVVILTGGPSRMKFFQDMCMNEFKLSKVIVSADPEYDISRGLCYAGSVDENAGRMLADLREYIEGDAVETKVKSHLPDLIDSLSKELATVLVHQCSVPALRSWKNMSGSASLNDLKARIARESEAFFQSTRSTQLIDRISTPWIESLMADVQKDLDSIAARHKTSLTRLKHGSITVDGGGATGVTPGESVAKLITALVSLISGIIFSILCGGAGTALIMSGPIGIIIAAVIAAMAYFAGKDYVVAKMMEMPLHWLIRKALLEGSVTKQENIDKAAESIRNHLTHKSTLVSDLTTQVSEMIDQNLLTLLTDNESQIVA